jgi:hypothetical protein
MAKIDIILLSGLTAMDGSLVTSGATLKFDTEFYARSNHIMIRPKLYRNREVFDLGYENVRTSDIPNDIIFELSDNDFYTLTPQALYEKVRDYLNNMFGANVFEINIIN